MEMVHLLARVRYADLLHWVFVISESDWMGSGAIFLLQLEATVLEQSINVTLQVLHFAAEVMLFAM